MTTTSEPTPVLTVAPARSRRDWTDAGELIHEYMYWVVPAIGWRSTDEVAHRIAPELHDPGGYYNGRGSTVFLARHDGAAEWFVRRPIGTRWCRRSVRQWRRGAEPVVAAAEGAGHDVGAP